jgi:hypothetical protein
MHKEWLQEVRLSLWTPTLEDSSQNYLEQELSFNMSPKWCQTRACAIMDS